MSNSMTSNSPVTHAWNQAVSEFTRWIAPLEKAPMGKAREHFLTYCRMHGDQAGLNEAAPLIAFGFLTKAAFEDAKRKTQIYR